MTGTLADVAGGAREGAGRPPIEESEKRDKPFVIKTKARIKEAFNAAGGPKWAEKLLLEAVGLDEEGNPLTPSPEVPR